MNDRPTHQLKHKQMTIKPISTERAVFNIACNPELVEVLTEIKARLAELSISQSFLVKTEKEKNFDRALECYKAAAQLEEFVEGKLAEVNKRMEQAMSDRLCQEMWQEVFSEKQ